MDGGTRWKKMGRRWGHNWVDVPGRCGGLKRMAQAMQLKGGAWIGAGGRLDEGKTKTEAEEQGQDVGLRGWRTWGGPARAAELGLSSLSSGGLCSEC